MDVIKKVINGVKVTYIKTDKFKSIAGRLHFRSLINKEKVTKRMLLRDIMIDNCKRYNTNQKLNLNCLENYDATYYASVYQDGNYITSSFTFSFINERFIDDKVTDSAINTFCEIVFNPNVNNDEFDKKTFDLCYKKAEEGIKRRKEDPDAYCFYKLNQLMGKDKPYAFEADLDVLKKQSTKSIYDEYKDMINDSEVSLYLVGDFDYESVAKEITKHIKMNKDYDEEIIVNNDFKKKMVSDECKLNTSASVLSVGFKCKDLTDYERVYVMPIYSNILGGGSTSRCFDQIREKNSLAYYAYSSYKKVYGIMYIYAGIQKENKDKTLNLMMDIQKSMKKITKKELDIAKKEIDTTFKRLSDGYIKLLSTYYYIDIMNEDDIEEKMKKFQKVTIKEVEAVHNKILKDAYFFVRGDK